MDYFNNKKFNKIAFSTIDVAIMPIVVGVYKMHYTFSTNSYCAHDLENQKIIPAVVEPITTMVQRFVLLRKSLRYGFNIVAPIGMSISLLLATLPMFAAFEAHIINVTATIQNRECTLLKFEYDADGAPMLAGQIVDDEFSSLGISVLATTPHTTGTNTVIVFDTAHPTGGDYDLGTPNEDFGGPGMGIGGKSGEPGENNMAQNNALIIAENVVDENGDGLVDSPDDERYGGELRFIFDKPVKIDSMKVIDIEQQGMTLDLRDPLYTQFLVPVPALGDNSLQKVIIDRDNVKELRVVFPGSGAIDDLCVVFPEIEEDVTENSLPNGGNSPLDEEIDQGHDPENSNTASNHFGVVLNEILPNPEGADSQNDLLGEWVELYNNTDHEVDVADWYIEDASTLGNRQTITSSNTLSNNTLIGARGSGTEWLVVFMKGAILNNTGDTVSLYNNLDELLDQHIFGAFPNDIDNAGSASPGATNESAVGGETEVEEGKSIARIPDGTGVWVDPVPTPGAENLLDIDEYNQDSAEDKETGIEQNTSDISELQGTTEAQGDKESELKNLTENVDKSGQDDVSQGVDKEEHKDHSNSDKNTNAETIITNDETADSEADMENSDDILVVIAGASDSGDIESEEVISDANTDTEDRENFSDDADKPAQEKTGIIDHNTEGALKQDDIDTIGKPDKSDDLDSAEKENIDSEKLDIHSDQSII